MSGWEYLVVALPPFGAGKPTPGQSAAVEVLNREGRSGWEAVGMSTLDDSSIAVLLKRHRHDRHEAQREAPSPAT